MSGILGLSSIEFCVYLDNYIKASPACKRAVLESVEALRRAGHECVEFELPECKRRDLFMSAFFLILHDTRSRNSLLYLCRDQLGGRIQDDAESFRPRFKG